MVCKTTSARRIRGFTLVELLIVMSVIVLVAAVTLPTMKGLLSGQKVSEASRIVRTYIESAKSRAIATGRPVALILDRTAYDGSGGLAPVNMCTRISMGDVFPAYTGDWAGARGTLLDLVRTDAHEINYADAIDIPLAQAASLIDLNSSPPVATKMVQAGDLIEIGTRRERYYISQLPEYIPNGGVPLVRIHFNNPPETTAGVPLLEGGLDASTVVGPQEFRIYRKPNKSLAGGVSLPRGTCIDLHFSGFGQTGRELSSDAVQQSLWSSVPTYPPVWPPVSVDDNWNYGPIYLVFGPNGQVSAWYFQNRTNSIANPIQQRGFPTGLIHLLVGATDQVVAQVATGEFTESPEALRSEEDYRTNIMDTENTWVTINPYTGGVTTSPVQSTRLPPGSTVAARVREARSLATNYIPTQP